MSNAIEGLKPELVWKYFAAIAQIPHPSKHETALAEYIKKTAKQLGLAYKQDAVGNVVVKKPATPGRESTPAVVLQGHMDMVPEKNNDKVHDFLKDPIELVRKDNTIMANGTTLGADNGIAVATHLAIMEDTTLEHGPLEFLFTVDEETGLTGANQLGAGLLESKILLNLDSEEEGALYVGCSGGKNTTGLIKVNFEKPSPKDISMKLSVKGLKGGHSGLEIDKGRGNSLKIINRVFMALAKSDARLSRIDGGNKHNAIPREADVIFFISPKKKDAVIALVKKMNETIKAEFSTIDPDLAISVEPVTLPKSVKVMKKGSQRHVCLTIAALPHGVIKMSPDIPGLVETSTNLAIITTKKSGVSVLTSQRSSVESEINEIADAVSATLALGGAKVKQSGGYPGWKPNLNSPVLKQAVETQISLFGKEPQIKAIHAGLECGIIGEKYPGMDMLSFGPTLEGVHSPDEKIHIDTVERFWQFTITLLKNIK